MSTITLRSVKGSELTATEIDANFTNLNTDKSEKASPTFTGTVTLPTSLLNVTASSYPTIRPSLNLDFANSQSVDPRITFTRASTSTRFNANGLIEVVASGSPRIDFDPATDVCKGLLIEEQRTNLLTYSENFDNAVWTKGNSTITANTTTAPDGTVTADKLVENTGTNTAHTILQTYSFVSGTTYTISYFVKAAERTKVILGFDLTIIANYEYSLFDLTAGTATNFLGTNHTHSITPFGNGWYRCSVTATATITASAGSPSLQLYTTTDVYTGDGTSGIYIWGAQLEEGSFATSYIPSSDTFTSRASTATYVGSNGLIQSALTNVARYNYNPVNLSLAPKLLLESASTNLLTYSEQFDNAVWAKTRSQINSNVIVAPDGTLTADKLVEDTQTGAHHVNKPGFVFTGGTTYCFSVYVQAAERSKGVLQMGNGLPSFGGGATAAASYDLIAGTCVKSVYADSAGIQQLSGGWFRVWVVGTCTTGATDNVLVFLNNGTTNAYTGDGTSGLYIWGAQLEASSFPTSYIPTVASQVTRAADISSSAQTTRVAENAVMTGNNFSSWYSQTEGTVLVDYDMETSTDFYPSAWYMDDGTSLNRFGHSVTAGLKNCNYDSITNNVVQSYLSLGAMPTTVLSAYAYKQNDFVGCAQGGTVITDTSGIQPIVNKLQIGGRRYNAYLNGHISKLSYYPKRLTNSELQALTTG